MSASNSLEDSAIADMYKATSDEKLNHARNLREMGENFDLVLTRFVAGTSYHEPKQQSVVEPFTQLQQWDVESGPQQEQQTHREDLWRWNTLDSLQQHFRLSPRFYDTHERCVSIEALGRVQHQLVAEYYELWTNPQHRVHHHHHRSRTHYHSLPDSRKKMLKRKNSKGKKKWCYDEM